MPATRLAAALSLALALAAPAIAQEGPPGFSLGVAGNLATSPFIGEDDAATALPLIQFRGQGFTIGTTGAFVTLFDSPDGRLEAVLTPRFSALDDPDAPALAGIDRDVTADLGLRYTFSIGPRTDLRATILQEVTGEHDGQELDLRISQGVQAGLPLSLFAGAAWRSADLSQYLYGVYGAEALPGRPAYDPGATLTPYIGLSAVLPLGANAALVGNLRADYFGDAITDSPIVEDSSVLSARIGVQFSF